MTTQRWIGSATALTLITVCFVACSYLYDPSERKLAGGYYLQRWEDGKTYYIEKKGKSEKGEQGGGVINGTVEQIGWNADYILVRRRSTFRGDPDGWMVLQVKGRSEVMKGPYNDEAMRQLPEGKGMRFMTPQEAWESLR